jgi:hypothetical protein
MATWWIVLGSDVLHLVLGRVDLGLTGRLGVAPSRGRAWAVAGGLSTTIKPHPTTMRRLACLPRLFLALPLPLFPRILPPVPRAPLKPLPSPGFRPVTLPMFPTTKSSYLLA